MVGYRTPFSSKQNEMSLVDANKTIILPDFYFGKTGALVALKSNVSYPGYIKFQVRPVNSYGTCMHIFIGLEICAHRMLGISLVCEPPKTSN